MEDILDDGPYENNDEKLNDLERNQLEMLVFPEKGSKSNCVYRYKD